MSGRSTGSVLVTGGAGYIGSLLVGLLLHEGHRVTVVDDLLFGGESLLAYWHHPRFQFAKGDVCSDSTFSVSGAELAVGRLAPQHYDHVIHLAAIVGFPACQAIGQSASWRYNVDPQSLYAETKIAAEQFLMEQAATSHCAPVLYRFATLFGVSPRTRFDLIINQFVLEALTRRRLIIYQRGYARSFVHVRDVCDALVLALQAPLEKVRGQIFNVGSDTLNYTKDEIVALVQQHVEGTVVEHKDLTFGGDMRDIRVSFAKIREVLGYTPKLSVPDGIREVRDALSDRLIADALDSRYRNAQFIVQ
jgi:nucleoside-diphosphate-sugar epimerase